MSTVESMSTTERFLQYVAFDTQSVRESTTAPSAEKELALAAFLVDELKALGVEGKALVVTAEKDEKFVRSASNIPGVKTALTNTINVYDIVNAGKLVLSKDAVAKIEEVYA